MVGATPSTPAQQDRYNRVLSVASAILSAGGEEALQMKDLAQRADVSLATLYRYFPSKDHVLLSLALANYQAAAEKVLSEVPRGDTMRERVTNHLMREFRAQQRSRALTTALSKAMTKTSQDHSEIIETILHLEQRILLHVAAGGGTVSEQHRRVLPIIMDLMGSASRRWTTGVYSAAEARFQIRLACHLLDLPDEEIDAELERAAPAIALSGGLPA
jgi:TetR/AcrR family transcriptional regulator, cholesterol catabolism regulator